MASKAPRGPGGASLPVHVPRAHKDTAVSLRCHLRLHPRGLCNANLLKASGRDANNTVLFQRMLVSGGGQASCQRGCPLLYRSLGERGGHKGDGIPWAQNSRREPTMTVLLSPPLGIVTWCCRGSDLGHSWNPNHTTSAPHLPRGPGEDPAHTARMEPRSGGAASLQKEKVFYVSEEPGGVLYRGTHMAAPAWVDLTCDQHKTEVLAAGGRVREGVVPTGSHLGASWPSSQALSPGCPTFCTASPRSGGSRPGSSVCPGRPGKPRASPLCTRFLCM